MNIPFPFPATGTGISSQEQKESKICRLEHESRGKTPDLVLAILSPLSSVCQRQSNRKNNRNFAPLQDPCFKDLMWQNC